MPRKSDSDQTTISVPIYIKKKLRKYGVMGDTWITLFEKMMDEIDEYRRVKDRYRLK